MSRGFSVEKVLVTGAGGFVGRHLLEALSRHYPGRKIVGTGLGPQGGSPLVPLDVTDFAAVRRLIGDIRPDICIHLAAVASVDLAFEQVRAVWDVNLGGTLNLAEAVLEFAPACRLVFASSGEIYGLSLADGAPAGEQTVLSPANPYATAKAAADLALGEMALRGLRVIRLRLFNHTGPGQTEQYVVPHFAAQVARIAEGLQDPVIYTGPLDRWRDFLDVRDVVDAYIAAAQAPEDGYYVNICSGIARRVGDILDEMMEIAQVHAKVIERVSGGRRTDVRSTVGSPQRAALLLGWRPHIAWDKTLRSLLAHWRTCAATSR